MNQNNLSKDKFYAVQYFEKHCLIFNITIDEWIQAVDLLENWIKNHPEINPGDANHRLEYLTCVAEAAGSLGLQMGLPLATSLFLEESGYAGC